MPVGSWRRSAIVVSFLGWAAVPGCTHPRGQSPPLPPACAGGVCAGVDLTRGRLTDLPEAVVRGDFRLSPPAVQGLTAEKAPDGGTLVRVRFAPDPRLTRTLTLAGGKATITLRDDGSGGDDRPDDRTYAATLPVPFAQIRDGQVKLAELLRKRRITDLPIFEGRTEIGRRSLKVPAGTERIEIFPPGVFGPLLTPARTLLVTDPGVIGDPARTFNSCTDGSATGTPGGVWTFAHLMTEMANQPVTGLDPEAMARAWFAAWVSAIPAAGPATRLWPANVDLAHAPFQLIAIVNRPDLATNLSGYGGASSGNGGELRFVFQFCALNATVIVEYGVPAHTCAEVARWARAWVALNGLTPGTATYDAALATLTESVVRRGAAPAKPNESALNQIRTDTFLEHEGNTTTEFENWFLHEWHIQATGQGPTQATVAQTPDGSFNGTPDLAHWINLEQSEILAGTDILGTFFTPIDPTRPFLGRSAESNITTNGGVTTASHWNGPGIVSNDAREKFSLNTCNGCHTGETGTHFRHLGLGIPPSGFLTGIDVPDPVVPSTNRHFYDLGRRATKLAELASSVCLDVRLPELAVVPPPFDPGIVELGPVLPPLPPITFTPTITSD